MNDESKLVKVITRSNKKQVGVVFLSTSRTTFMYKIRDKSEWNTGELFLDAESYVNGPHLGGKKCSFSSFAIFYSSVCNENMLLTDPYTTSGFIALQLAIDEAFLIFNNVPASNYRKVINIDKVWC